jgi:hypothetical protein
MEGLGKWMTKRQLAVIECDESVPGINAVAQRQDNAIHTVDHRHAGVCCIVRNV